ncbi:MAG: cyclic nucleotide-binding domain-containing protein [Anaerolineae bacterium]
MDLTQLLRAVPLFRRLSAEYIARVAALCELRSVRAGTRLCRQADRGTTFFLIGEGEAVIHRIDEKGAQRPAGMLRAGESFGVTSLFLSEPRDATVTAVTDLRLWTIKRAAFQTLLADHPRLEHDLEIPEAIRRKLRAPRFSWMEPSESVLMYTRRHWMFFARQAAVAALVLGAYALAVQGLVGPAHLDVNPLLLLLPGLALFAFACVWYWFDWQNDVFVVTTWRVSHQERIAFLYETRDEAPLDRIQNITTSRDLFGALGHYGTLIIETAAEVGKLRFDRIPYPDRMSEAIFSQMARLLAAKRAAERYVIRDELASRLKLHAGAPAAEQRPTEERPFNDYADLPMTTTACTEIKPGGLTLLAKRLGALRIMPRTRLEREDELIWRKHWVFLLGTVMWPALIGSAALLASVLGLLGVPTRLLAMAPTYPLYALGLTIVCAGWFWWEEHDWANDLYILTRERIVDVEKRPLFFAEQRREANISKIQNVSLKIPNMLAAALNYGDVVIQTAGSGEFTFDSVPNPRDVQREIFRRLEAYREDQRMQELARRRSEMGEWFTVYDDLQKTGSPLARSAPPQVSPEASDV